MTEPSVETAEGRNALREAGTDCPNSWLAEALNALDARDAALAEARAALKMWCDYWADFWGNGSYEDCPHEKEIALKEATLRALKDPKASLAPALAPALAEALAEARDDLAAANREVESRRAINARLLLEIGGKARAAERERIADMAEHNGYVMFAEHIRALRDPGE